MKEWFLRHKGIWLPLILAGALVALAWIQYVWLRDLSEGQRDRMRQNASVGAQHFADEYLALLSDMQTHFQFAVGIDRQAATPSELVRAAWFDWESTSEYKNLIKSVYWAGSPAEYEGGKVLQVHRDHTEDSVAIASIPNIAEFLSHRVPEPLGLMTDRSMAYDSPPILALSMMHTEPGTIVLRQAPNPMGTMVQRQLSTITNIRIINNGRIGATSNSSSYGMVFIELDESVLKEKVIPALIAKHLNTDGMDFRAAIAQKSSLTKVFYIDKGDLDILEHPDIEVPMLQNRASFVLINTKLRTDTMTAAADLPSSFQFQIGNGQTEVPIPPDQIRDIWVQEGSSVNDTIRPALKVAGRHIGGTTAKAGSMAWSSTGQHGWSLLLQHRLGSIDAAADHFRRRSSALSLGILSILGISMMLIVRNNRRSNDLARQQMEFVAGVSHELRTPLSVIRSAGDNMVAGLIRDEESAKRYGRLIHSESLRLSDLVEQVLEFSGIQAGQRRYEYTKIDLVTHCIDSIASLGSRIDSEAVSLQLHVMRNIKPILADHGALTSVIQNLVMNAMKYSDSPAKITLTIDEQTISGNPVVLLKVRDEGYGIPKEDLPRIFDPFYRGRGVRDRQIKGNGLGLSIVSSILRQHDATISVVSEIGKGTEFTVSFRWLNHNEKPS